MLIHRGNTEETEELLNSQTDRIIIPINVNELVNPQRGDLFLRSRIVSKVGEINLFGMSSAITSDEYFFGRHELVQTLITRNVARRQNSGLFGLRKTGKTSVLQAIKRRLADRLVLAEYIECSNPGVHAARWWQVLENLITKCADTLQREHKRNAGPREPYTASNAGIRFISDIKSILLRGELEQIVLMLDEVEFITPDLSGALGRHWDDDFLPFWQTIRSTHQEIEGRLTFIVAGVNPACVEMSHLGTVPNPIFQLASPPHYLQPFTTDAVREMVRSIGRYSGLRFEEDIYQFLQETYGGHPYLIRIACSKVWAASNVKDPQHRALISLDSFHNAREEIQAGLAQPIKDILLSLVWWYPEEYELLRLLADGATDFVDEYLENDPRSMLQFANYGILKRDRPGDFAIADLKEFLKRYGDIYKKEISPFKRGDLPPEYLPEVPDLDVLGDLFQKRTAIEIKLREAILLYIGVQNTWDQRKIAQALIQGLRSSPNQKRPEDLFVGREPRDVINELFTLDLKVIILEYWTVFAPLFDKHKERFKMNMDTLNIARRVDAHTKPVSNEELLDFDNSYNWLLNKLSRIPTHH